ncbi:Response regulator receiver domain-containing protein [Chitinophaga eiseniae]|uniref:Response regulator receiver domain-containing protein n=1 Tax=Chitinophaga eiseniae TaxID=634771 RepID=A0A1T4U0H9_9BACT|nr:response regulator [Chitinophaga eiseniae]SKA46170.1 Response regulator receiver domain-containing protein [Chitinophaga eiseniae]
MVTWQRKPYNILWVDDDPFFLHWIIPQITTTCFIIQTFEDAPTALAHLKRVHPDIVLTNLVMPHMSGLEMIAAIRCQDPHIPIVVVSNRFQDEERQAAFKAGANSFLSKAGINGEAIMTGIRPYLGQ